MIMCVKFKGMCKKLEKEKILTLQLRAFAVVLKENPFPFLS